MPSFKGAINSDVLIPKVLTQTLPGAVLGIILILVLSASMSTLASLVLASSSAITMDLIYGVFVLISATKAYTFDETSMFAVCSPVIHHSDFT